MTFQILNLEGVEEPPAVDPLRRHDAESLTGGKATAEIALGDQVYVLRITRAGKLLLTK